MWDVEELTFLIIIFIMFSNTTIKEKINFNFVDCYYQGLKKPTHIVQERRKWKEAQKSIPYRNLNIALKCSNFRGTKKELIWTACNPDL